MFYDQGQGWPRFLSRGSRGSRSPVQGYRQAIGYRHRAGPDDEGAPAFVDDFRGFGFKLRAQGLRATATGLTVTA